MTANDQSDTPKRRFTMLQSCLVSMVFCIALVGTAGYLLLFRSMPLKISKETTHITEPLTADGTRVDYFAAWEQDFYPENMATDENGYRMVIEHLGRPQGFEHWEFEQTCEKLGLAPAAIEPDMRYCETYEFVRNYLASKEYDEQLLLPLLPEDMREEIIAARATDEDADETVVEIMGPSPEYWIDSALDRPWTWDELPLMQRWVDENTPALDMLGQAVRKPMFRPPLLRAPDDEMAVYMGCSDAPVMRSYARCLSPRAYYYVGTGDIDRAIDDVITCRRLGRHYSQGVTLLHWLIGIAVEGIGQSVGVAGSFENPPTKEQLERYMRELDAMPPRGDIDTILAHERFCMLEALQYLAGHPDAWPELTGDPQPMDYAICYLGYDWNVVARRANEHYDNMLATRTAPTCSIEFDFKRAITPKSRSEMLGDIIAGYFCPAYEMAIEAGRRSRCSDRLTRITLAMLLYECDHGTLPPAFTADKEGNPLHSWRVLLLPYLGQQELYGKIRLDEPWDSEHNRQFHNEAVDFYRCPSVGKAKPGETTYTVIVGPDMPFEAGEGKRLTDFGPHSADMILVTERADPVCWMDPTQETPQAVAEFGVNQVFYPDSKKIPPSNRIASPHPGCAIVGQRDGAVRVISETIEPDVFRNKLKGTNETLDY